MTQPNTALAESRRLRRCKSSVNAGSPQSQKFRQLASRRQSKGNDSFWLELLLMIGNHPIFWFLLIGGSILCLYVIPMRDAVQILQYQRGLAPIPRQD